jgi:hypothetical protein
MRLRKSVLALGTIVSALAAASATDGAYARKAGQFPLVDSESGAIFRAQTLRPSASINPAMRGLGNNPNSQGRNFRASRPFVGSQARGRR